MESKIRKLEKAVEQQGYLLLILMIVLIVNSAALLILWGEKGPPDFDHIAVSLTVFQTMFGIAALYGFWALRGLTREKAEEVTESEVRKIAPPLIRREMEEFKRTFGKEGPISEAEVDAIVAAAGSDGKGGEDGGK